MNPLDLKYFLNEIDLKISYRLRDTISQELVPVFLLNGKYDIKGFQDQLLVLEKELKGAILISLEKNVLMTLASEYKELLNHLHPTKHKNIEYYYFDRIKISLDNEFFLNEAISWGDFQGMNDLEFLELRLKSKMHPIDYNEVNNPGIYKVLTEISYFIKYMINDIINFCSLIIDYESPKSKEASSLLKSKLDILSVKQQMLVLHYLLEAYKKGIKIPHTKLSKILAPVLGRGESTILGLLTNISNTPEKNEDDDKIAKTPKNLGAVHELFNKTRTQELIDMVGKDLERIK